MCLQAPPPQDSLAVLSDWWRTQLTVTRKIQQVSYTSLALTLEMYIQGGENLIFGSFRRIQTAVSLTRGIVCSYTWVPFLK